MSKLYAFYKIAVPTSLKLFFAKTEQHRYKENVPSGEPIIFVANHPSGLIDPLVCGTLINDPVYFLGRADIFKKKFANWFLRSSHMWPIYRDVDGKDSLKKNEVVFKECYESLVDGNPILLYGEGVTDERFIRRVKKIKKGAARIAFGAEDAYDFKMGLKVIPIGINYSNPEVRDSDVLINFSEPIVIADYKEEYDENPVKAILSVTKQVEQQILENTTHVNDKKLYPLFESLLFFEIDTMHYSYRDFPVLPSVKWVKTKRLADRFNEWSEQQEEVETPAFVETVNEIREGYGIKDIHLLKYFKGESQSFVKELMLLWFGLPFFIVGWFLNGIYVKFINFIAPKMTPRICFHSGFRTALPMIITPLWYTIVYLILESVLDVPFLFLWTVAIGMISGVFYLKYVSVYRDFKSKINLFRWTKSADVKKAQSAYDSAKVFIKENLDY